MKDAVVGYFLILCMFAFIGFSSWYFVLQDIFG